MNKIKYVLGIDIGGTNFRMGLVDESRQLEKFEVASSSKLNVNNNPLYNLKTAIQRFLEEHIGQDITAISIGVPSTISRDLRTIYSTPNIEGFNNLNIACCMEDAFNVPVFLNRDVNYLLKYDMLEKEINKKETTLGFYIGTGVGNSIFINGEFLYGKNGTAGELGHVPVMDNEKICGCGNTGCMETLAAGRALGRIREEHFLRTAIEDIFIKHGDSDVIKRFINWMTIPIVTEINILDPDNVIIGGGVIQMEGFPLDYFEKCLFQRVRKPYPAESLKLQYSRHFKGSGIIGGACFAFEKLGL